MSIRKSGAKLSYEARQKMSIARKGKPKGPEWRRKIKETHLRIWDAKGRRTPEYLLLRASPDQVRWSKKIIKRANHKCEMCGAGDIKLHAHHLIAMCVLYQEAKLLGMSMDCLFHMDNGIAVCVDCHHKLHSKRVKFGSYLEGNLFLVLKRLWEQLKPDLTFADFYKVEMDRIIEAEKLKLEKPIF